MKINEVKHAEFIGNFFLDKTQKLRIKFENHPKLKSNNPRVYLITVDGEIKKIGGSACRGGIYTTIMFYIESWRGSPGPSRFIIRELIESEIKKGSEVKVYLITSDSIIAKIRGLNSVIEERVYPFKEKENLCKSEYKKIHDKFPDWNFQENNEEYPYELRNKYNEYHKTRISKKNL